MAKKNISKKGKSVSKASKSQKKVSKKVKKDKRTGWLSSTFNRLTLGLIVFLIIFGVVGALNYEETITIVEKIIKVPLIQKQEQIAASVNGEIVTVSELEYVYNRLPAQTQTIVTKDDLLDQIINEKILVQEAIKKGINITDQEVNEFLDNLILQSGISKEEFEQRISSQNISNEMIQGEIYKQLIITKLYQQEIIDKVEVTDEDAEDYYNDNIENFRTGEQVKARHILICHNESSLCDSNTTKEEALAKAEEVKDMINDTNFEALAIEFSQGPSAQNGGDLGFFGRGVMVAQFEEAAFSSEVGEVSDIIETSFGYHIIKVDEKKQESHREIDEVKPEIEQTLLLQKQQETFKAYLDSIKANSEVINFFKTQVIATTK